MERAELVGREDLLDQVEAVLADTGHGGGRCLLVGEAGAGKTAALEALAGRAATRSVRVAWGQCWEEPRAAPAYWPWIQVMRAASGGDASVLDGGPTDIEAAFDRQNPGRAATSRFELFDRVASVLAERAGDGGLLVVLDDLQWADEPSLDLLDFLAHHRFGSPLQIVGGHRGTDRSAALRRLAGSTELLRLEPLTAQDSRTFVAAVASRPLAPEIASAIVDRCGGNPLFLRELTRLAVTSPASIHHDASRHLTTVREVVQERLTDLSTTCQAMLEVAAVLAHGGAVALPVLADVMGQRPDLRDLAEEAEEANVLVLEEPLTVRFSHELFREVIVSGITPAVRAELHLTAARAVEGRAGESPVQHAAAVASHYWAAASLGLRPAAVEASRWSVRAARHAADRLAHELAVQHLQRALEALDLAQPTDPKDRVDVLLHLGTELDASGNAAAARPVLVEAADISGAAADGPRLAAAAIALHRLGAGTGLARDDTAQLLREAAIGLPAGYEDVHSKVLASLARELHHSWDPAAMDEARAVAGEAVNEAAGLSDASTVAFCLLAQHDVEWSVGSAPARLEIVGRMQELARSSGDRELEVQAQLLHATALLEIGDGTALEQLERYCRAAGRLGHARGRWGALSRRAVLALMSDRLEEAATLGAEAAALGHDIGEPDAAGVWDTLRWELARFRGGLESIAPGEHWVPSEHWPPHRALQSFASGDHDASRAALRGTSVSRMRNGGPRHDGWVPAVIAHAVLVAGDDAQVAEVYDWLAPLAGTHLVYGGCMGYGGAVDHHVGLLAQRLGRTDDARDRLEAARHMHATVGATPWVRLTERMMPRSMVIPRQAAVRQHNAMRRDSDLWSVTFAGRSATVKHVKGMNDLAVLLRRSGQEVSCVELMGAADTSGPAGVALDDRARREYQRRVSELRLIIADAREAGDWTLAERSEQELDFLVDELAGAFGLGGRPRITGSTAERARVAVTHRLRSAIRRLGHVDPALGRHLENAVRTGHWCVYRPDTDVAWSVNADAP